MASAATNSFGVDTMNSPYTFLGKCSTLIIGGALSWLTVTNPETARVAACIFGDSGDSSLAADANIAGAGVDLPSVEPPECVALSQVPGTNPTVADPASQIGYDSEAQNRMETISLQLKRLGACYLLLEKLTGSSAEQYRVRCDIDSVPSQVKCCFEATRASPVSALEDVLQAVLRTQRPLDLASNTQNQ